MDEKRGAVKARRAFNGSIKRIGRLHRMLCEKRLASLPIHSAQHMLLMRLSHTESIPSQRELAAQMEISPAAVAVSLKKLEGSGYIQRSATADDNRINEIFITSRGKEIIEKSRRIFDALDAEMFEGISHEELDACLLLLEKLQKNLRTALQH